MWCLGPNPNSFWNNFYPVVSSPWASAGGQNGHFHPLEIGAKKQKILENVKSGI